MSDAADYWEREYGKMVDRHKEQAKVLVDQHAEIERLQNSENELDAVIDGLRDKLKIGNPAAKEK
jgi:hypothetical protein